MLLKPAVVTDDVQRSGPLEQRRDRVLVGDVHLVTGVRRPELFGTRRRAVAVEVGHDDAAAVARERLRRRPTDARRAANDERGASVSVVHH